MRREKERVNIPDYDRSYTLSKIMSQRIQKFWHDKGFTKVRVWVEEDLALTSDTKSYNIRSNITFNANNAARDLSSVR